MQTAAQSEPRWFQFRLAALLGLTLLVAVVLAAWANLRTWHRTQQAAIEGKWNMVSINGDTEFADAFRMRIDGRELFMSGDENPTRSRFTIDVTQDPPWIDIVEPSGKLSTGIYSRNGDTLTVFLPKPGQKRPASFNQRQANLEYPLLLVFRRTPAETDQTGADQAKR